MITLRPAVAADLDGLIDRPLPFRIQAMTMERDGTVLGVGGLGFRPGHDPELFLASRPEIRRYPVALGKAGLAVMDMVRRLGVARVLATADPEVTAAVRWLIWLGFDPVAHDPTGDIVFVWHREEHIHVE